MKNLIALSSIIILSNFTIAAACAEVKVIVHPSTTVTLDKKAIKKIFMGKSKSFPGGGKAKPIGMKTPQSTTSEFNSNVLGKKDAQIKSYWSKLVFTGKGTPPKEVHSEREVVELIKSDPSTIGYVSAGTPTEGVKVVGRF